MCGRYRNTLPWSELRDLMVLARPTASEAPNIQPDEGHTPHDLAVGDQSRLRRPGGREASLVACPLLPRRQAAEGLESGNLQRARRDRRHYRHLYKGAFARRRCLVPASGWG